MDLLGALLVWAVFGLVVGAIARLLVPGRDPMGCLGTILLGVVGSLIGGFLAALVLQREFEPDAWNWIGAVIGAVILLLLGRMIAPRRHTHTTRDR